MAGNRVDLLDFGPGARRIPPVMEYHAHLRMIGHPFSGKRLRRGVATVPIHDKDTSEPLFGETIQDVRDDAQVSLDAQRDAARKRAKIRCDTVGYNRKDRKIKWLRG